MIFILFLLACASLNPTPTPVPTNTPTITPTFTPSPTSTPAANAANPCLGAAVPPRWHHIVVLMFENKSYDQVIGPAPYITTLAQKCATAPNWKDADFRVGGSRDGEYVSKPSYATLTNGLPPSVHGLTNDAYGRKTDVTNICDVHDVPLSTFMEDVNSGNLPAFSMIIPSADHFMHDNDVALFRPAILGGDARPAPAGRYGISSQFAALP